LDQGYSDSNASRLTLDASYPTQAITIHLNAQLPESMLNKVREVFERHPGYYQVYFAVNRTTGNQKILTSYRIAFTDLIAKEIEEVLGKDTVRIG